MADKFTDKQIPISLTGEQWFAILAALVKGKASLSESGREVLAKAMKILSDEMLKHS